MYHLKCINNNNFSLLCGKVYQIVKGNCEAGTRRMRVESFQKSIFTTPGSSGLLLLVPSSGCRPPHDETTSDSQFTSRATQTVTHDIYLPRPVTRRSRWESKVNQARHVVRHGWQGGDHRYLSHLSIEHVMGCNPSFLAGCIYLWILLCYHCIHWIFYKAFFTK